MSLPPKNYIIRLLVTEPGGEQNAVGSFFEKDGTVVFVLNAGTPPWVEVVANEALLKGIHSPKTGAKVFSDQPEIFLECLPYHFDSAYLRARMDYLD